VQFERIVTLFALYLAILLCFPYDLKAETRRALLVGINIYNPQETAIPENSQDKSIDKNIVSSASKSTGRGPCINLDGAVNDVVAMQKMLTKRYSFDPKNIHVLINAEAKRDVILRDIQKYLITQAAPGDVSVFFFAGHGSQVINSKSAKPDGKDETIVPADSIEGAPDIRDKELAQLFNKALDKGVILTVFFDSCHSGSVLRGFVSPVKERYCSLDTRDIAEPPDSAPPPEQRGALVFSAAQDFQSAFEAPGGEHGAFTMALLDVLEAGSEQEPTEQVFRQVKALMQTGGSLQEPVLAGTMDRRQKSLFGGSVRATSTSVTAVVLTVEGSGEIEMQGGLTEGISKGSELRKVGNAREGAPIRIRVTEIEGFYRCRAKIIEGNIADVKAGDLFEMDRWIAPKEARLSVWLPPAMAFTELIKTVQEMLRLRESNRIYWIDDPADETPTHVMSWEGSTWKLTDIRKRRVRNLGKAPTTGIVLLNLKSEVNDKARLFIDFPPPAELIKELQIGEGTANSSVEIAPSEKHAHYRLVGHARGKEVAYALVLSGIVDNKLEMQNLPLPMRTDWITVNKTKDSMQYSARKLEDFALRIGKVKYWLLMKPLPDKGYFPYRLALKNSITGETKTEVSVLNEGSYDLVLQAEEKKLKPLMDKRYIYIFKIDWYGNSTLLFPLREAGSVGNRVPYDIAGQEKYPTEIRLGGPNPIHIDTRQLFGVATYILLSSQEAIPNPSVLEFQGVQHDGLPDENSPLPIKRLDTIDSIGKGPLFPTAGASSIQRILVKSSRRPE
jgi:hypothetical protein